MSEESEEDKQLRAYGGDPDFMRRLKDREHLTDDFLKNVGDTNPAYSAEWLAEAQKMAAEAAENLFSCKTAPMTDKEKADHTDELAAYRAEELDRGIEACRARFDNAENFGGFPAEAVQDVKEHLAANPVLKMYAVFSPAGLKAMKGNRGKLVAQAGHAFLHAWWNADDNHPELAAAYRRSPHAFKIGLNGTMLDDLTAAPVDADEAWFDRLIDLYSAKTGVTKVIDAAFTVFDKPTLTGIGIGPISPDDREEILKGLKPLL